MPVRQFSKDFKTKRLRCVSEVGMGESGTQVGENAMRGDLENEDNRRRAILAHDEGVVTDRQSHVAGTSLWGSSQGEVCNVNSGSSDQLESIEPVVHAAGTVDSQDGSGLVM